MTEYTITYTAEITAVVQGYPEYDEYLLSNEFPRELKDSLLNVWPEHQDVHIRDLKIFISKEEPKEEEDDQKEDG